MQRRFQNYRMSKSAARKKYQFTEWDCCPNCGLIQNYNEFRVKNSEVLKKDKLPKKLRKRLSRLNRLKKKQRKLQKQPKYKEYIKSAEWRQRRERYYLTHMKECRACKSTYRVSLHHLSYRNVGKEKDEELVPLCWQCHEEYHEKYGTKDVENLSNAFIIEKQEDLEFEKVAETLE